MKRNIRCPCRKGLKISKVQWTSGFELGSYTGRPNSMSSHIKMLLTHPLMMQYKTMLHKQGIILFIIRYVEKTLLLLHSILLPIANLHKNSALVIVLVHRLNLILDFKSIVFSKIDNWHDHIIRKVPNALLELHVLPIAPEVIVYECIKLQVELLINNHWWRTFLVKQLDSFPCTTFLGLLCNIFICLPSHKSIPSIWQFSGAKLRLWTIFAFVHETWQFVPLYRRFLWAHYRSPQFCNWWISVASGLATILVPRPAYYTPTVTQGSIQVPYIGSHSIHCTS